MVVVFTISEINYLVIGQFYNLVLPLSYLLHICGVKCFGCTICLVLCIARKVAVPSLKSFTIIY